MIGSTRFVRRYVRSGVRSSALVRSGLALAAVAAIGIPSSAQDTGPGIEIPRGRPARPAGIRTDRVASDLLFPIFATHAPGDADRLFIVEQRGVILILDLDSETLLATPYLDIDSIVEGPLAAIDERGLLGMAFHPAYASNGLFYVYYMNSSSESVISEFQVTANPNVADAGSERILGAVPQPQLNHNGGWMGFGPLDGYLYIATGDGGGVCDAGAGHTAVIGNAQDITDNFFGKLLRIDPLGNNGPGGQFGIPADNPFVGVTGDDSIWAYGLRSPWRCSFDAVNGDLYIGDVGQNLYEEVNYTPALTAGENYGWRCMEGDHCSTESGCQPGGCICDDSSLADPIHCFTDPVSTSSSVTGGYVYRGTAMPELRGTYFFADFVTGKTWSFRQINGSATALRERTDALRVSLDGFVAENIASFGEDGAGEIYIVDRGQGIDGEVFKIVPRP